jgi:hypothetical protein
MSQAESKRSAGRSARQIIPERTTKCHPRMGLSGIHTPLSSPNGLVGDPVLLDSRQKTSGMTDFMNAEMTPLFCHLRTDHKMSSPNGLIGDPHPFVIPEWACRGSSSFRFPTEDIGNDRFYECGNDALILSSPNGPQYVIPEWAYRGSSI